MNQARGFDGTVLSISSAIDKPGMKYVGGEFTTFTNQRSKGVIRLQADGTPDETFQVGEGIQGSFSSAPNRFSVYSLAAADDGVFVGGSFGFAGGLTRPNIAKFKTDGSVDTSFVVGTDGAVGPVRAMWFDPSRGLYIGGASKYRGVSIGSIARILPNGSIDPAFAMQSGFGFSGQVLAIAPDPTRSDRLYVAGSLSTYQDQAVGSVVRLFANGSLDTSFSSAGVFTGSVYDVAVLPDGSGIYVAGVITRAVGGDASYQNGILRLFADGRVDEGFHFAKTRAWDESGVSGFVTAIALASDGSGIYLGGQFGSVNGSSRSAIAKLNPQGGLDASFVTGTGVRSLVYALKCDNNRLFVGGPITGYNGVSVNRFLTLNSDGSINANTVVGGGVHALASSIMPLNDGTGRYLLVGSLEPTPYVPGKQFGIMRMNANGTNDSTFVPVGLPFSGIEVAEMKKDGSGRFYLGGNFTKGLMRVNADGSIDPTFAVTGTGFSVDSTYDVTNHAYGVSYIFENADRSLFVVGKFKTSVGAAVQGLIKLTESGALATDFDLGSGFDRPVRTAAMAQDGSGDIYVGGEFTQYRGTAIRYLARLKSNGDLDTSFDAGLSSVNVYMDTNPGFVMAIAVSPDNSVYATGWFDRAFGTPVGNLVKVSAQGALAPGFASSTRLFDRAFVKKIVALPDGGIIAAGYFVTYKGAEARQMVRIAPNGDRVVSFTTGISIAGASPGSVGITALTFIPGAVPRILASGVMGSYRGVTTDAVFRIDLYGDLD